MVEWLIQFWWAPTAALALYFAVRGLPTAWYRLHHPGRCQHCGRVLRDDATTDTCSQECADEWWMTKQW